MSFKPELSAGNTKLWEKYQNHEKDIHVIEHLLPEYCYDYTQVSDEYRVKIGSLIYMIDVF